jgi:hypothetical protein
LCFLEIISSLVSSSFKLVHASINADDAAAPATLGQQRPVQNKDSDAAELRTSARTSWILAAAISRSSRWRLGEERGGWRLRWGDGSGCGCGLSGGLGGSSRAREDLLYPKKKPVKSNETKIIRCAEGRVITHECDGARARLLLTLSGSSCVERRLSSSIDTPSKYPRAEVTVWRHCNSVNTHPTSA